VPQAAVPSQANIANTRQAIIQELGQRQGFRLYNSGAEHARVNRIVRRLSAASGLGGFSYPVYIADAGRKVNAMAVNGNTIVVYKELLRRVPNDNELAAVLAHEVAHITNRHHQDNTMEQRDAMVQIGSAILGSVVGSHVDVDSGRVARDIAGTVGKGAFVNSYSRSMEFEADHTGMLLMAKAGYNPEGALSFWGRSKEIFGSTSSLDFLSTHPADARRLERLRQSLPLAMQYYRR
jgi:predicted Zn-dependent protease